MRVLFPACHSFFAASKSNAYAYDGFVVAA
jgi:hypothetical protein